MNLATETTAAKEESLSLQNISLEDPTSFIPHFSFNPQFLSKIQSNRLSVSRLLIAKMLREQWKIEKVRWDIDKNAKGEALYRIDAGEGWVFWFPVFSFEHRSEGKSGRIIGQSWDMMAALLDGEITEEDIETTRIELPKLYSGRATKNTLIWARCNRSERVFDHTVDALANGLQPSMKLLSEVCYLMRNTGLDGNGTFGTKTFAAFEENHPLRHTLYAQMLSAYLMRVFSIDLVHHLAKCKNKNAITLDKDIQRYIGVGNGSALGIVLFVNNHPMLINNWMTSWLEIIYEVLVSSQYKSSEAMERLLYLLKKSETFFSQDKVEYEIFCDSADIAKDLAELIDYLKVNISNSSPKEILSFANKHLNEPSINTLLSLFTELAGDKCDQVVERLNINRHINIDSCQRVAELLKIIENDYSWTKNISINRPEDNKYVWYKSVTAEEPRRGPRCEVPDAINLGLDIPQLVDKLHKDLLEEDPETPVSFFLLKNPTHRDFIERVQWLAGKKYHSPHMKITAEYFIPAELVRFVNSAIHGIDKTRDYLGRNLRGVIFHGAPLIEDINLGESIDWFYPKEPVND